MRDRLDFGGGAHGLIGGETTLGIDQVRRKDGVDQGRLAQTGLALNRELSQVSTIKLVDWLSSKKKRKREQRRKKEAVHTNTHNIELKTTLQQLPLNLGSDTVKTDVTVGEHGGLLSRSSAGSGGHCGGRREEGDMKERDKTSNQNE